MTIHRLEPAKQFVTRIILLNRFHAPDEEDYDEAGHKLGSIHRNFPDAAVHDQAAYLIAAISAAKPFVEANFRTAFDYTADMLAHEGYQLEWTLPQQQELGHAVWDLITEEGEEAARAYVADWCKPRVLHVGK